MDALYEESAVNEKAQSGAVWHTVVSVIFWVFLIVGVILTCFTVTLIPIGSANDEGYQKALSVCLTVSMFAIFFIGMTIFLFFVRRRINVSYDYAFVSGDIRISKVFNVNKRKPLYVISAEEILQIGDMDNGSYDVLAADPTIKQIFCTANTRPMPGKFFMYIYHAGEDGRVMYILECRETLLEYILRYAKRGTLESDYVRQDKKQLQ